MNSIKFNDWSDLGLKKDIEQIKNKIYAQEPIVFSIGLEIVITVGAVLIDHFFDTDSIPNYVWIITSIIAITPPALLIIRAFTKYFQRIFRVKKGKYNIEKYIDTFDNSICYWAMMSCSFLNELSDNQNLTDEEKIFYYQEITYYINKIFFMLDEMSPMADKIFSDRTDIVSREKIISIKRLEVILCLLNKVYNSAEEKMNNIKTLKECVNVQKQINSKYKEMLNRFLYCIQDKYSFPFQWTDNCS